MAELKRGGKVCILTGLKSALGTTIPDWAKERWDVEDDD